MYDYEEYIAFALLYHENVFLSCYIENDFSMAMLYIWRLCQITSEREIDVYRCEEEIEDESEEIENEIEEQEVQQESEDEMEENNEFIELQISSGKICYLRRKNMNTIISQSHLDIIRESIDCWERQGESTYKLLDLYDLEIINMAEPEN